MIRAGWVPLVLVLITGCAKENASEVDQTRIYTSYSASYDDTDQSIGAMATFYFGSPGGTYLVLDGKSSVVFNGQPLDERTTFINQAYYEGKWKDLPANQVWANQTFIYTNNDGTVYTNAVTLPKLLSVQYSGATVQASSTFTVNWTSPDVIGKDSLSLELKKTDGGSAGSESFTGDLSQAQSGTFIMTSDRLKSWGRALTKYRHAANKLPRFKTSPRPAET